MEKVRIVGVPEHFNLPWHMALEEGAFGHRGIDLQWTDVPEGTGRMCQMLQNARTDLAIILTEGIVKSITDGNPSKIVQEYIATPLLWGIHVGAKSHFKDVSELKFAKTAISRFGSGSHLMAYVNAQNKGWDTKAMGFQIVHTLDGAIGALQNDQELYFMWEYFTTKPLVDQGVFRRLGDCPTPWPCFVIAANAGFLQDNHSILGHILEIINTYTRDFKRIPSIDRTLANRYGQQLEDIKAWLAITSWSQDQLSLKNLEKVQETLLQLDLIKKRLPPNQVLDFFNI